MNEVKRRRLDAIVVWRLDRFGRNLHHLISTLDELRALNVGFVSIGEGIDTTTPVDRMNAGILGSIAEFEREGIRERIHAGLARAKRQGQRLGRRRQRISAADLERVAGLSVRGAAKMLGVPPSRVHRERNRLFQNPANSTSQIAPEMDPGALTCVSVPKSVDCETGSGACRSRLPIMKCLLLVSLVVIAAASLSAQTGSVLTGRVMDVGQAPLPGVKVTISGTVERTAITDPRGEYRIDALPSGIYSAKAELVGFATATETVKVPGEEVTVDFYLRVALCGPDPPLQVFFPFDEHLNVVDVTVAAYVRIREVRPRLVKRRDEGRPRIGTLSASKRKDHTGPQIEFHSARGARPITRLALGTGFVRPCEGHRSCHRRSGGRSSQTS